LIQRIPHLAIRQYASNPSFTVAASAFIIENGCAVDHADS